MAAACDVQEIKYLPARYQRPPLCYGGELSLRLAFCFHNEIFQLGGGQIHQFLIRQMLLGTALVELLSGRATNSPTTFRRPRTTRRHRHVGDSPKGRLRGRWAGAVQPTSFLQV